MEKRIIQSKPYLIEVEGYPKVPLNIRNAILRKPRELKVDIKDIQSILARRLVISENEVKHEIFVSYMKFTYSKDLHFKIDLFLTNEHGETEEKINLE